MHKVKFTPQSQLKATLQNKAYFFPCMLNQTITRLVWRNDMNIGLQKPTPLRKCYSLQGNATGPDYRALSVDPNGPLPRCIFRR